MVELEREFARARRTQEPLVVVFVDVDRLKDTNDTHGHAAGDRMLRGVASSFKQSLRAHDLIVRYGGDEFICAISGLTAADVAKRLAGINAALRANPLGGSVTFGLAQMETGDSLEGLVARADADLYKQKARASNRTV